MPQTLRIDPLPVQCCQCFLACAHSTFESAAFAEAVDGELDPLALAGRQRPERQPIAALVCWLVVRSGIDVTAYAG